MKTPIITLKGLDKYINLIESKELKQAILRYLEHHKQKIEQFPASLHFHHTWYNGLLEHTVEVCEIVLGICKMLVSDGPNISDLMASAVLHDMGKVFRYDWGKKSHEFMYPSGGNREMIDEVELVNDFESVAEFLLPKTIRNNILSHHGGWSKTGVFPETLDSSILHSADLISSRKSVKEWLPIGGPS